MRIVVNSKLREFLRVRSSEEALDNPLYHIQTYGTSGAATFSFFGTTASAATNGFSDTNLEVAGVLPSGKRFAIYSFGLAMLGGQTALKQAATLPTSQLDDLRGALEGIGNFIFNILDKPYYQVAPLAYIPAGFGVWSGAGGVASNQASAADEETILAHGHNGVPTVENARKLRVPIPIPSQAAFSCQARYASAVTIGTAARLGVWLGGLGIRPRQ